MNKKKGRHFILRKYFLFKNFFEPLKKWELYFNNFMSVHRKLIFLDISVTIFLDESFILCRTKIRLSSQKNSTSRILLQAYRLNAFLSTPQSNCWHRNVEKWKFIWCSPDMSSTSTPESKFFTGCTHVYVHLLDIMNEKLILLESWQIPRTVYD